jgi:hypothetical protein
VVVEVERFMVVVVALVGSEQEQDLQLQAEHPTQLL